jgi:hypothetical protein
MTLDVMAHRGYYNKKILEDGMSGCFENLKYRIETGIADLLWNIGDKIEGFGSSMKFDEEVIASLPLKMAEKKRKTGRPSQGIFPRCSLQNLEVTSDLIKVHRILDGFDETAIRLVKSRIVDACTFILGNAGTETERYAAMELAKMLRKGAVIITDADLVLDRHIAGCFYTKEGSPYIGLDIAVLQKADDAALVNILVHEAYHAWRYFTSDTEYSVIDEKRAWNIALAFSNRYRNMYGIPVEREKEYTENDLLKHADYMANANVNTRFGPGEHIIEKIGYGIANIIEDAADAVDGWSDKLMDRTVSKLENGS